jgi:membrane-bound lytic murein transglycosylase D
MNTKEKYIILAVIIACLLLGFTSSKVLERVKLFAPPAVNIFEKNECPGVRWIHPIDSSKAVYPISVEGELYFADERVPLEDPDVKERLDRELQLNTYWHSNTVSGMRLANRYFGEIEKILREKGVPADFKYLALVESGFRNETSPAGAVGFWQFVKPTATQYGLEVGSHVDERYHLEKSTEAACAYLKEANEKLGNWTVAAASYNLGIPGMRKRINDQKTNNYYQMYFNQETSRYIFRMLAMKIIFSNPEQAGFNIKPEELYQPYAYKEVEVDTSIGSIADFASQFGLRYKHIKILNLWLRDAELSNKDRKKYRIKIMQMT